MRVKDLATLLSVALLGPVIFVVYNFFNVAVSAQSIIYSLNPGKERIDSKRMGKSLSSIYAIGHFAELLHPLPKPFNQLMETEPELLFFASNFSKIAGYEQTEHYLICIGQSKQTVETYGFGVLTFRNFIPQIVSLNPIQETQLGECARWSSRDLDLSRFSQDTVFEDFSLDGIIWIDYDSYLKLFTVLRQSNIDLKRLQSQDSDSPGVLNLSGNLKALWKEQNVNYEFLHFLLDMIEENKVRIWFSDSILQEELQKTRFYTQALFDTKQLFESKLDKH